MEVGLSREGVTKPVYELLTLAPARVVSSHAFLFLLEDDQLSSAVFQGRGSAKDSAETAEGVRHPTIMKRERSGGGSKMTIAYLLLSVSGEGRYRQDPAFVRLCALAKQRHADPCVDIIGNSASEKT